MREIMPTENILKDNNIIITIGRQYGSWGLQIGKELAEKYGVELYDKEMLKRAAKASGFSEELFTSHDEKPTSSFLYSLVMDTYSLGYSSGTFADMPINHKVFLAQFDAIRQIADEGACILVGRCADYALEEYDNVISIFIYADMDARIQKVMEYYETELHQKISVTKAKDIINKEDKRRASYYNYYTNKEWGDAKGYDLCINSAKLGVEGTVRAIEEYVKIRCQYKGAKL